MVEQQPSKLMTRVRFPSPAPLIAQEQPTRRAGQPLQATSDLKMLEGEQIVPI
jgi:hypothetical protein